MFITTESVVTDKKEKDKCSCGNHGGMPEGMDGMY